MPERLCESTTWHNPVEPNVGVRNIYLGAPGPVAWRFFMRMKDCGCETNRARCQKCFDRLVNYGVQFSRTRCDICGATTEGTVLDQIVSLNRIFSD